MRNTQVSGSHKGTDRDIVDEGAEVADIYANKKSDRATSHDGTMRGSTGARDGSG